MRTGHLPKVEPLHLADVTLPDSHPLAGEACAVYAFLILHPDGAVLVDTGVGPSHPGIDRLYRPVRRSLIDALAELSLVSSDVAAVINTHLHFDHCGENRLFPNTPIYVLAKEYEAAHEPLYTVSDWVDFPDAKYELLDGEAEVLPGVSIVPTPGHTPGHQSVLIEHSEQRVIIAGQAVYVADEFAGDEGAEAKGAAGAWDAEEYAKSFRRLRDMAPRQVYFSHDKAVWERAASSFGPRA